MVMNTLTQRRLVKSRLLIVLLGTHSQLKQTNKQAHLMNDTVTYDLVEVTVTQSLPPTVLFKISLNSRIKRIII